MLGTSPLQRLSEELTNHTVTYANPTLPPGWSMASGRDGSNYIDMDVDTIIDDIFGHRTTPE
eukprot:8806086-Karenia_brevis.AAC.1